jgi:hypothetical protein
MSNTITLTDEQYKALQNGQAITIEPPKKEKPLLIINQWGRRTYKTAEAERVYANNDCHPVFVSSYYLARMQEADSRKRVDGFVPRHHLDQARVVKTVEGEVVLRAGLDTDYKIKDKIFIFDDAEINMGSERLMEIIVSLVENGAKAVHYYGPGAWYNPMALKKNGLWYNAKIRVNVRYTPEDIQMSVDEISGVS